MSRIKALSISNYRSIGSNVTVELPKDVPVVLIGENNAGKSNIVRALDLLLGQTWPGTHDPDDNEFHSRDRDKTININAEFYGDEPLAGLHDGIKWSYDQASDPPVYYRVLPGTSGYPDGYVSNAIRGACTCVVIEAERNLNYHLSYASKWTLLSRLMHRFHKALLEDSDTKDALLSLFQQVRDRFNHIQPFVEFKTILQERLGEFAQGMSHRLEVDFEAYNPVNFFHALRLHAAEGNERRTMQEMGTGEQQILALSFAYAYATVFHEGIVLIVEEPESHLHPLAQQWLASRLKVMCEGGLQVIITTHSPHFIDILSLPGTVLVSKREGRTAVRQLSAESLANHCVSLGASRQRTTATNILPFYHANATPEIVEGLFARLVILVEGRTEALGLPPLLSRVGFEAAQHGVAVIPVHGKGNLAKWQRFFNAYGIPSLIVFDNDSTNDPNGSQRTDALSAAGVGGGELRAALQSTQWLVGQRYCVFGEDFEASLRSAFPDYAAKEQEARNQGVTAKPFVARAAIQRILYEPSAQGWQRVVSLQRAIESLLSESS